MENTFDTVGAEAKLTRLHEETARKHLGISVLHVKV